MSRRAWPRFRPAICNAIDYAHSRGVLHRDIKPGNIIVGKHGETLVVDWGLAKPLGTAEPGLESGERTLVPSSASGSAETLPGSALGTPAYMSPEQARGDLDKLGPRSDVYSLGATLYCLLTGRPPFEGDDIGEVLRKVQRGDFARPRQLDPLLDKALEVVCLKAMAALTRLADGNPAVTQFQNDLARTHNSICILQWQAGKPAEALESCRRAQVIFQKLADESPAVSEFQSGLAMSHTSTADVLRALGRAALAREGYERAIAIGEELVKDNPKDPRYRSGLAASLRWLGLVRLAAGNAAGAVADARRAAALYEGLPARAGEEWFELACCHAELASAAGRDGSGISAGSGETEAGKAMDLLRRAVTEGYRKADVMAQETALDPLRNRPDFQLLMMDLAFPAEPFAR